MARNSTTRGRGPLISVCRAWTAAPTSSPRPSRTRRAGNHAPPTASLSTFASLPSCRRSTRTPSALLDSLVTSVFLLDQHLHVLYLNSAAQTLLGLGPNQALGRSITELTRLR